MARIVWLASYPKSGNTWLRALFSAVRDGPGDAVDVNRLRTNGIFSSRWVLDEWLGVDSTEVPEEDLPPLQAAAWRCLARAVPGDAPLLVKVHDAARTTAGALVVPLDVTSAVLYVVRCPLDVVVSFAHHLGTDDLDAVVARLADPDSRLGAAHGLQVPQRLGSWSSHVAGWLDVPCPVEVVRYEDLLADAAATFGRACAAAGVHVDSAVVARAVEATRFERLRAQEEAGGFRERPRANRRFFRHGRAGGWRVALTPAQATQVVADHAETMRGLRYLSGAEPPQGRDDTGLRVSSSID